MKNMTIKQFCDEHDACADGKAWAMANCKSMPDVWKKLQPDWLVWVATRRGVLTDTELRLFACWCVRQIWHLLTDKRSRRAVEVAERFAEGKATQDELTAARAAAWAAAWDAAWDAARAAAWDAAWAAVRATALDAAWDAARAAARDAARDAVSDAARAAARDAARDAVRDAQATYLRENTKPNFRAAGRGEGER